MHFHNLSMHARARAFMCITYAFYKYANSFHTMYYTYVSYVIPPCDQSWTGLVDFHGLYKLVRALAAICLRRKLFVYAFLLTMNDQIAIIGNFTEMFSTPSR